MHQSFANAEQTTGIWSGQEFHVWYSADNTYILSVVYMCKNQVLIFHYLHGHKCKVHASGAFSICLPSWEIWAASAAEREMM